MTRADSFDGWDADATGELGPALTLNKLFQKGPMIVAGRRP
jgi:hypothetical protein